MTVVVVVGAVDVVGTIDVLAFFACVHIVVVGTVDVVLRACVQSEFGVIKNNCCCCCCCC